MKILIIGFLAFLGWSVLSSHLYVCGIKGLCDESATMQAPGTNNGDAIASPDSVKSSVPESGSFPGTLSVYFSFDKYEFSPDEMTKGYFDRSNAYLDQNTEARICITGYTDAIGSAEYNQLLGLHRAQTLQSYFMNKGMKPDKVIVESKGEKDPVGDNNSFAGRSSNRRVVITIKK
jgi:outer membrane protein OmpA-like peptidoglycan-associated protein